MGKKGSWFSAIKRVFVSNSSNDKIVSEAEEKRNKKKSKGRNGDRKSFIPLFREPSSIEKILGEAEREHNLSFRPPLNPPPLPPPPPQQQQQQQLPLRQPEQQQQLPLRQPEQQHQLPLRQPEQQQQQLPLRQPEHQQSLRRTPSALAVPPSLPLPLPLPPAAPPRAASPRPPSPRVPSPRVPSPRAPSPRAASPRNRPEPTLRTQHASATKIQALYRGYMARRSFRALRGLVRLQGVVKGQNVKRQTMNAMKYMQMLVRVQSQIQSRRIQMLETQARDQANFKEGDNNKFTLASEGGNNENWDHSVLTKAEADARLQRKVEAIMKRERAMAYAYSNQLWKSTPKSTHTGSDLRSGGVPWWWNWLEKQLPQQTVIDNQTPKSYRLTPSRLNSSESRPMSSTNNTNRHHQRLDNTEAGTPRSSTIPSRLAQTPPPGRTPLFGGSKYSRSRQGGGDHSPFGGMPLRDDDSLISCPPFSVPNYMVPTVSAQAKARPSSNPRERFPGTPGSESSRRSSFPLTQMGSYKWNKGSFFSGKDSSSQRGLDKNQTRQSMDNKSVDSTVSLPVGVGRKPFNRFV